MSTELDTLRADPETAWAPDVRRKIDRYNRLETAA